ncbi:MAG: AtpZ/AtpI family protein [Planctomycetes bacterium]|nr:AtpZ/AtpI family protein [Planctomycetota bacterium]
MSEPEAQPPKRKDQLNGLQYLNLGMQLAVAIGGFTALGYWLDGKFGWSPWGTVGFGMFGVVVGLYHFLKSSL